MCGRTSSRFFDESNKDALAAYPGGDRRHSYLLDGKNIHDIISDRITRAALERFLEIISEASRHVPQQMKDRYPQQPWRSIADIGNVLRHAYHHVVPDILWSVYENDLASLEEAVEAMIAGLED